MKKEKRDTSMAKIHKRSSWGKLDAVRLTPDAYVCGGGKSNCDKGFNPDDLECRECEKDVMDAIAEAGSLYIVDEASPIPKDVYDQLMKGGESRQKPKIINL